MESPVARVFGIDSSVIAISVGYTCTAANEVSTPDFFGDEHHRPTTFPMDRSCLLNKLRPQSIDSTPTAKGSRSESPAKKTSSKSPNGTSKPPQKASSSDDRPSTLPMTSTKLTNNNPSGNDNSPRIEIRLSDFAAMMMDAASTNRTWVQDFSDDQVAIPKDLYEVLLAYQRMRKAG